MEATQIKLRSRLEGKHIRLATFARHGHEEWKLLGVLHFAVPEDIGAWQLFGAALLVFSEKAPNHVHVTTEGDQKVVDALATREGA